MPMMVNAENSDKDFREKVEKYFVNMNTKVPSKKNSGLELEVGLKINNEKPILFKDEDGKTIKNLPISIEDWLKWRHAKGHPYVAASKEEGDSIQYYEYYIEDREVIVKREVKIEALKDKALVHYLNISKDENLVDMYLALLGSKYKAIPKDERIIALKKLSEDKSQLFLDTVNDENSKVKFFIHKLVSSSIVQKEGNRYLLEGEQLATTELDFVEYLKDDANSETKGILKARLAEFSK